MASMQQELVAAGYQGEVCDFYRLVARMLAELHPGWTDERLKRYPRQALDYCDRVRATTGLPGLCDPVILGALENGRKRAKAYKSN